MRLQDWPAAFVLGWTLTAVVPALAQSDVKSKLKAQTSSGGAAPASDAKSRLKTATADDGFSRNESHACPFLTKPSVRADGGGLNRHAGGSMLCFQKRAMLCVEGRWVDRGNCYVGVRDAHEVERTEHERMNGEGEGGPSGGEGDGNVSASGGPQLLGGEGEDQEFEAEQREIERRRRELAELNNAGPGSRTGVTGGGGGSRLENDAARAAECAKLRAAVSQNDEQLRRLDGAIREGFGTSEVRNAVTQVKALRGQLQGRSSELGCR